MTKITKKWMIEKNACGEAVKAWEEKGCEPNPIKIINLAMEMNRFDWANWLIVRVMTSYKQYVSYAVFAAEQIIDIYEQKYPNDKRPRAAIEAAKKCITAPTKKNKAAAANATTAAYAATAYADAAAAANAYAAAAAAANAAAYAATYATTYAAAYAATYATYAATYATYAATYATYAATYATYAAEKAIQTKIINYGIRLLKKEQKQQI
jgi:hypothetical protein